ncbi:MAG: cupin domain-containing protein [Gammaproteobacteria bacterium]|nr:cupin domain-containing protein [Gammaproteobacteria bacterium]
MPLFQSGKITNKLMCGLIDYDKDILHPILNSLPPVLHFSNIKQNAPI